MLGRAFDSYALIARMTPTVLLLAPPSTTVVAMSPTLASEAGWAVVAAIAIAVVLLVSQFVRDAGRRKETELITIWGSPPTVLALRHFSSEGQRDVVDLHRLVAAAANCELPTIEEERWDPALVDRRYEAAITTLREKTRAVDAFPTIAAANATYGFRRNLLGVRPLGIGISALGLAVSVGALTNPSYFSGASIAMLALSAATSACLLAAWLWQIDEEWVRIAADDYSKNLLNACAGLSV